MQIFTAESSDGVSLDFELKQAGKVQLFLGGTWDGATVQMKAKHPAAADATYADLDNGSFTANTAKVMEFAGPATIKATISSAGGSTSLDGYLAEGSGDQ